MIYQSQNSVGRLHFECIRYRNFQFPPHMHRHFELIYVHEGAVELEIGGQKETISAGGCALILSNRIHAYATPEHSVLDVCVFSEDYVPVFAREVRDKTPTGAGFICRESVRAFAGAELFTEEKELEFYNVKAALYAVTGEFLRQAEFSATAVKNEGLVDRIIRYVAENFREDITLNSAAQALGYEKHYLSRCFHTVIPMHFSRYVNLYRVDAATELMQNTDLPITEIALKSGFQSIRSFNRVYREVTGRTPRAETE